MAASSEIKGVGSCPALARGRGSAASDARGWHVEVPVRAGTTRARARAPRAGAGGLRRRLRESARAGRRPVPLGLWSFAPIITYNQAYVKSPLNGFLRTPVADHHHASLLLCCYVVTTKFTAACSPEGPQNDDGELLVRASAVLKRQEARKLAPWETQSPLGAHKLALCPGHIVWGNPGGNCWWGGVV